MVPRLEEALKKNPPGSQHRSRYNELLGVAYQLRYKRDGDLNDLEHSITRLQEAVDLRPHGHPDRPGVLENLSASFSDRYRALGAVKDLDDGLQLQQEAVDLTTQDHPNRSDRLGNLAVWFSERYQRLGALEDHDHAHQLYQEAVSLMADEHPDRPGLLRNLAVSFSDRYRRFSNFEDLNSALETKQAAVDLTPKGHPDRPGFLQNLAVTFSERYQRLGDLKDLDSAVSIAQEAVDLMADGNPEKPILLQTLALVFTARYRRLGDLEDLHRSLRIEEEALVFVPPGHPDRSAFITNFSASLSLRYQEMGLVKDLEYGLQLQKEAVGLMAKGDPHEPTFLKNLAVFHVSRYQELGNMKDIEDAFTYYAEASKAPSVVPQNSWEAALAWASTAELYRPSDCPAAYMAAFRFLPELLWMGHSISIRHTAINRLDLGEITSTAAQCCIHVANYVSAVEIIEQGVATTFQQILQLKTDVDHLPLVQAQTFRKLSSELYSGSSPASLMSTAIKRNKLLEEIRSQPGFEYFLLPKPYRSLQNAAKNGPIIILNSHEATCDVLIILHSTAEPIHVPLANVTPELLKSQQLRLKEILGRCNVRMRGESAPTRLFGRKEHFSSKSAKECFEDLLTWLWKYIVEPVYQTLEHGIQDGRLWWLPTGSFTGLPLHACPPTDHFIHSYTTTLGSLLEAYGRQTSGNSHKFGVVGVIYTGPGRRNFLRGVEEEVKQIAAIIKEPFMKCVQNEQATVESIKPLLQDSSWVHLACHGTQDLKEPTKSCLLLYGGDLELETILQMPLPNAEFVFLAACQTAKGDATLVNEAFHLGGGFLAAGFRGAVGTLWSMTDADGPLVAESFYSHLFRHDRQPEATDAAEALHHAVKDLRARGVSHERWIPFIHLGI
ncbi:CHAT domain-containing protein [Mycena crocata]|nr:CHAT domain-containing protein [Mycena crocata]